MRSQKSADPEKTRVRAERRQLLVYLTPETILKLKTEALQSNRHVYEIVQDLVDAHYQDSKSES